ncbi:MAG: type II toxin-antitoxin system RelE/ParE family toxin [Bacteroidetes bacterium]|nr:type II toxin-antitoxin system RelE/ParE family toxin [Bacteroidota bacterium]
MAYEIIEKKKFANKLIKLLIYLETEWSYDIAKKFMQNILHHFKLLEQHPNLGKPTSKNNARSILISKHNRIIYKISNNKIIILDLIDTRTKTYHT